MRLEPPGSVVASPRAIPARSRWIVALSVGLAAAALAVQSGAGRQPPPRAPAPIEPQGAALPAEWPAEGATLSPPTPTFPDAVLRVMIDPGHGARDNSGNTSSFCVAEQDAMLDLAEAVADRLEATGHVAVRLARDPGQLVDYAARLQQASAWRADAFVSLHSDVRGKVERWSPAPGLDCRFAVDAPGFAVLYSDEGAAPLVEARLGLGRAVARRMAGAGFLPYDGVAYAGLYAADDPTPGLFVDRHAPAQRIFVLRRGAVPAVLIETHNALDPREASRWTEPDTIEAFAAALAAALADALPDRASPALDRR